MAASPLPWRRGNFRGGSIVHDGGKIVCEHISGSDIDVVLRAVNNHDSLIQACAAMLLALGSDDDAIILARKQAREAIARAIYPHS